MKNHKIIMESSPEMFTDIKNNFEEVKAVDYCKKWRSKRKWLKANKVNFIKWPEEIMY